MYCKDCIHRYVCRKSEGYEDAYNKSGLIITCEDFLETDAETRIKREAREMLENIINKEFKQ